MTEDEDQQSWSDEEDEDQQSWSDEEDEDEDQQSWSDEGDWYIRMIIDSYEEKLAERDERIRELVSDVEYYKYEAGRTW